MADKKSVSQPHWESPLAAYLTASKQLKELCKPLIANTPIDAVEYVRFFHDRQLKTYTTHLEYLPHYLKEQHYADYFIPLPFKAIQAGYFDPLALFCVDPNTEQKFTEIITEFSLYNQRLIINLYDGYCDGFTIMFNQPSKHNINFFLNNAAKIKHFFRTLTPEIQKINLELPKLAAIPEIAADIHVNQNTDTTSILPKSLALTSRQKTILHLCLEGRSAKNIAAQLNLSYRTVQNNVEEIKDKFDCQTINQLLALFILK